MTEINSVEGEASCLIPIREGDCGLLAKMKESISRNNSVRGEPIISNKSSCIFRVPQRFKKIKGLSYEPKVISIGPYHHGQKHLMMMEQFKWQCLKHLVNSSKNDQLQDYVESIRQYEEEARKYYDVDTITSFNSDDFIKMMVLDGCFIIQFLRFSYSLKRRQRLALKDHPLGQMHRVILPKIYLDLLLLENQIPYFVLESLFEISMRSSARSYPFLSIFGLDVFSPILGAQYDMSHKPRDMSNEPKYLHLLDLVRSIFIPSHLESQIRDYKESTGTQNSEDTSWFHKPKYLHLLDQVRSIFIQPHGKERLRDCEECEELKVTLSDTFPCISMLHAAGIKVNPRKNDSLLVIEILSDVIFMPNIILSHLMCSFLVNCVAFEHCHNNNSKHFSIYALFLNCLVKTANDLKYLCDHRVIQNDIETDGDIETDAASFINDLGKSLMIEWADSFRSTHDPFFVLCNSVNVSYQNRLQRGYCKNKIHQLGTSFKHEYLDKPWLLISGLAAFVLLVLTIIQTYYTMHPKH